MLLGPLTLAIKLTNMSEFGNSIKVLNGYDKNAYTYYPVLIVGAGESGIAMGCQLKEQLGFDQFRIFERGSGVSLTSHFASHAVQDFPTSHGIVLLPSAGHRIGKADSEITYRLEGLGGSIVTRVSHVMCEPAIDAFS